MECRPACWISAEPLAEDVHYRRNSGKLSDVPNASCCGEADAYWADGVHVGDGKTYVTITDDRPDEPLGRPHLDVGTEIEIPNKKLKWDKGNPTGHGIVFLSRAGYSILLRSARGRCSNRPMQMLTAELAGVDISSS
jgi:hypothetical protein